MDRKNVPVSSVRGLSEADGIVEAIVSVTNVVDSVNDVIEPGAYKNTLRKRNPKGVWSHDTNIPVAKTLKVEELMPGDERLPEDLRSQGAGALMVKMQFNLNTSRGRDAFHDVQFFAEEQEWSIGYSVPEGKSMTDENSGVRFIKQLELYEYSPVIFGAAPNTRTLSVKDDLVDIEDDEDIDWDESKAGDYSDLNFKIPDGVKKQAQIGLDWSREYNRGGTSVGKNTANYLINNTTAAPRKVRHIAKYFPRHEVDLRTPANSRPGADGYPGAGLIAWKLWGGDAGQTWSTKLVEAMNRRDEQKALDVKAEPGDLKVGDFVSWNSSGGTARGKITRILRRGRMNIPDSSFTINATPEDPAAMIRVYKKTGEGWEQTETMVGHKFSTLRKIEALKDIYTDMPEGTPGSFGTPQRPGVVGRPRRRRRTDEGKPYRISRNTQGCSGYAVVKEGESSPVPGGCHETLAEARRHMAALYAAEAPKDGLADIEEKQDVVPHQDDMIEGIAEQEESGLTPRQFTMYDLYETIAENFGKWDQTAGADGAHYAPASANPFKEEGLMCVNCAFFQGGNRCEIVEGDIEPEAICKLWIIKEDLLKKNLSVQTEMKDEEWDAIEAKANGGPIRSHSTAVRDDTPINRSAILAVRSPEDPSYYKKIFAYQLPKTDGTRKTHYTFIHHHISKDGAPGAAAMSELRVQMSVLNGARGGTVLRGADRKAVYNHLAKHYRDGGTTPPSLKSDHEVDNLMIKRGYISEPLTKEDTDV